MRRALLLLLALPTPLAAQAPVRSGVTVTPDTVTVGQPFVVRVRVRAPAGATISFPAGPDSTAAVQALDPRVLQDAGDAGVMDRTAVYRVAAWDVGAQPLGLADVVVRVQGREQRVPLAALKVFVRSVLPADSAGRVPKPARALVVLALVPWWLIALIAACVALIAWLLWRRRRRVVPAPVAEDPFVRAQREFARVAALGLVEAGERGRHVTLVVEVLRDYLAARYRAAPLSLTSDELLGALEREAAVPQDALRRVLHDADLVKFARQRVSAERALQLAQEAQAVVAREHEASQPPAVTEAA